jgi:hypothetical protein
VADGIPEQVFKLGQRVTFFHIYDEVWIEGIVFSAILMGDSDRIAYGCLADNGYSCDRLEVGQQVRALSVVDVLGRVET